MKESFDKIIKRKLQDLDVQHPDAGWEQFKERLNADNVSVSSSADEMLDQQIKTKLKGFERVYNPLHWKILRARLKRQARNLENLYVSKAFETITFILLLLTFAQNGFYIQKSTPVYHQMAEQNNINNENQLESTKIIDNQVVNEILDSENALSDQVDFSSSNQVVDLTENTDNQSIRLESTPEIKIPATVPLIQPSDVAGIFSNTNELSEINPAITESNSIDLMADLQGISSIDIEEFDYQLQSKDASFTNVIKSDQKIVKQKKIGAHFAADNFLINTPADEVYKNIDEVLFNSVGYGGGISYESDITHKLSLGLGLDYSSISYAPQQINEVFLDRETGGVYSIYLDNISFDLVSIPVYAKYQFAGNNNWSLFSQLGISSNFVSRSEYVTEVTVRKIPVHASPAHFSLQQENENGPKLFDKAFSEGVLQGGQVTDNLYFTANVGLGFSKNLSDRFSIFTMINYKNHVLDYGVGPNQDKLGSLSFLAGAQYALN